MVELIEDWSEFPYKTDKYWFIAIIPKTQAPFYL